MNPISLLQAHFTLYLDNGTSIQLPLTEQETGVFTGQTADGSAALSVQEHGSVYGVTVDARVTDAAPIFGYQRFLDYQKGAVLSIPFACQTPFVAIVQHKEWWLRPYFGNKTADIPENTQLLLWQTNGVYHAMAAPCGAAYRADIGGSADGLHIRLSSNCAGLRACSTTVFTLASGSDPYRCCEQAVELALELTGSPNRLRKEKRFPNVLEHFGWCSWDAFYHKVSEAGILDKLDELQEKDIPVGWVLIDDGWSEVNWDSQQLRGLDASPDKFPHGLRGTVDAIKEQYGIPYVGVWQAVTGYWNGVEANSDAHHALADTLEAVSTGQLLPRVSPSASYGFWNTWHRYLAKQGIDFIKVDSQSSSALFHAGHKTYGDIGRALQNGLDASAALHFRGNLINCMGMAPQEVWNRADTAVSRSSDDFVPRVPHGFREHAIQNAYNSLLHGQLYWGDWDMFWSDHSENWQNSVLRAVSGGPVYTSDEVGKSDAQYILPLLLDDSRLLRCEGVGMPTTDCLFTDPVSTTAPLKLFNTYGDCVLMAVFNINRDDLPCSGEIRPSDVPALSEDAYWVVNWRTRETAVLTSSQPLPFTVQPNDAELFLLLPKTGDFTAVGLLDKYLSVAAIDRQMGDAHHRFVFLKQGGVFGFFADHAPKHVFVQGEECAWTEEHGMYLVDCTGMGETTIQIAN